MVVLLEVLTLQNCSKSQAVLDCIPLARRMSKSAAYKYGMESDDVFQDIMLEIVRASNSAAELTPQYLHAAARNARKASIVHFFRKFRSAIRPGVTDISEMDIEEQVAAKDPLLMDIIKDELSRASEVTKAGVIGSYFLGMTHDSIANVSGATAKSSRTMTERFVKKIRHRIGIDVDPVRGKKNETVYTFVHERAGREIRATASDMAKAEGLDSGNLNKLIKGKTPSVKGWRMA